MPSKDVQWCPKVSKGANGPQRCIKVMYKNLCEGAQRCAQISIGVQRFPQFPEGTQVCPAAPNGTQRFLMLYKSIQMCQKVYRCANGCTKVYTGAKVSTGCPMVSKSTQWFPKARPTTRSIHKIRTGSFHDRGTEITRVQTYKDE
jgi:hypothetical protein